MNKTHSNKKQTNHSDTITGVFESYQRSGFLRDPDRSYRPGSDDPWVSPQLIREHKMVNGALIMGSIQNGPKGPQLKSVNSICDYSSQKFRDRLPFTQLAAVNPSDRIRLGDSSDISMRIVDLIAPIGRGTRGLIVSPPKSGKTQIIEQLAHAIQATEPDTRIIVLLIDERPEEVTHFRRSVNAEVLASSSDQSIESHVRLAELTLAHIRCELECGRNIVVLVDSITRLSRAFNLHGSGSQRTLSGGLDARAMEIPRRFFGIARNIEKGGSVTVIATAQVDTGSRMDNYIFEEFKSTGNSEIVLDRSLAENRIYPAINFQASGTRREELLYTAEEMDQLTLLRRYLVEQDSKTAMRGLLKLINQYPTNKELLSQFQSKK
jgi:transcription termination factor Rho